MGKKKKKSIAAADIPAAAEKTEIRTKYDNDDIIEDILLSTSGKSSIKTSSLNDVIREITDGIPAKKVPEPVIEADKPVKKAEPKPVEKAEKPVKKVEPKPAEKAEKPVKKVEPKPAEKAEKPVKRVEPKPAEKAEKPVKKVEPKPVEKAEKPVKRVEPKPAEKAEKPVKKAEPKPEEHQAAHGKSVMSLSDMIEMTEEDTLIRSEISENVKAAIAEKAKSAPKPDTAHEKDKSGKGKAKKGKKTEAALKPLKPVLNIANIVYSALVFIGITAAFLALPRSDVSVTEQRELAKFPVFSLEALLDGSYTKGLTDYFNDNVPYRDDLKRAGAQLKGLFGISYNDAKIVGPVAKITEEEPIEPVIVTETEVTTVPVTEHAATSEISTAPVTEETTAETTTSPAETTAPPVTTKNVNEIAEGVITNGQVVTKLSDGHWWGISLFGGGNGAKYAAAVNRFKSELGDSVNVYSMPVPTSGEYYLPDTYDQYNASHQKSIDAINSQLVNVIPVPASTAMWEHVNENIYLRTDHHWQPLGAYYAAKCFAETAGVKFADISTMQQVDVPGYMGTMYGFTEDANLLNDPEVFTYYKPSNSYKTYYYNTSYGFDYALPFFVPMPVSGSYSTFMGGDKKIVRISTDAGTGRKLVIFKDSYGNAEIPFYFGSFDEIYVCDMRYFDLNGVEFVKFTGATDLLFTMCTFSAVGTNANGLETILNNPVTEITESAN